MSTGRHHTPKIRVSTTLDPTWSAAHRSSRQRPSPTDTIASGYSSMASYRPSHASSSSSSSASSFTSASSGQSQSSTEGFSLPVPQTNFAIALFNFYDSDPAVLSFDKGDVIEVMSKDPSGWWDCLVGSTWNGYGLGGEVRRGWVPSNYVKPLGHRSQAQAALFCRSSRAKMDVDRRRRLAA